MRQFKLECEYKAYSGYILCERGFGMTSETGIIIPGSTMGEKFSLVLSAGPDCKHGIKQGDLCTYGQGVDIQTRGPNGGQLFTVPENAIGCIKPCDGVYPRNVAAAKLTHVDGKPVEAANGT